MTMEKESLLSKIKEKYIENFEKLKHDSGLPGDLLLLTEDRYEAAMDYLRIHYMTDEPCAKSGGQQFTEDLKHHWFQIPFSFGLSVMLLRPGTDEIIAIQVIDTETHDEVYNADDIIDAALRQTNTIQNRVVEGFDMFSEFRVDEVVRFQHLSVDKNYRNQGIATKLVGFCNRILNNVANDLDIQSLYAKVHCTSEYSLKVFQNNGFNVVNSIRYDEYYVGGELVFPQMGEHTAINFLLKRII